MSYADAGLVRDWIIIIVGSLGIIMMILFLIMALVLYRKVMAVIDRIKRVTAKAESVINTPYYHIASWIGGICAGARKGAHRKN